MILLQDLENYCETLADRIPGITSHLVIHEEGHLSKHTRDLAQSDYPLLVATYPTAQSEGRNADAATFTNGILFFVLVKHDRSDRTYMLESQQWAATQGLALRLAQTLLTDASKPLFACGFPARILAQGLTIEPENSIAGHEGWSIAATYSGTGYPDTWDQLEQLLPASFSWLAENW